MNNDGHTRLVVGLLGAVSCLSLIGIGVLAALGKPVPDVFGTVASTATGALVGILVPHGPVQPPKAG
jgi:hypothetical protein